MIKMQFSGSSYSFENALALHQQGLLDQALDRYLAILENEPHHAECIHLLGVIAMQKNQSAVAVDLIEQAIALRPQESAYHFNLANALVALNNYESAIVSFSDALQLRPLDGASLIGKGNALLMLGCFEDALKCYDQALIASPDNAHIYCNRAHALEKLQLLQMALSDLKKAVDLAPDYAEAWNNMGNVLLALQKIPEAILSFDRAIDLQPHLAQAYSNRGNALKQLKQPEAAVASFNKAIELLPHYPEALSNRGIALQEWGDYVAAIDSFNQAIALQPDYAQAYCNRSVAELAARQFEAALESCNRAIQLDSKMADAYCNRGNAERGLKHLQSALASYQKAIELQPTLASAYCNMGVAYKELQMLDAAIHCFDHAIALDTDYVDAYWNKALTLLLGGNFQLGWRLHEYRWNLQKFSSPIRHFDQPLWLGHIPLLGKTIFLHSEQGMGDTLQFCRYVQMVAELGAKVILEVPAPLLVLLQQLKGVDQLIAHGCVVPDFDVHCPLMSLPLAFGTHLNNIPSPNPYLFSNAEKKTFWKQKIQTKYPKTVGIVWRGSALHNNDANRSIHPTLMLSYLPAGFNYVCLQKELTPLDFDVLQNTPSVQYFSDEIKDFSDTAALCDLMDAVITIDTSVAHLSAAMGRPTYVLLPHAPDWRWLLGRDDSPWYNSIRLYRQKIDWDWHPVLQQLCNDLLQERLP